MKLPHQRRYIYNVPWPKGIWALPSAGKFYLIYFAIIGFWLLTWPMIRIMAIVIRLKGIYKQLWMKKLPIWAIATFYQKQKYKK